jgi:hypothetical protein
MPRFYVAHRLFAAHDRALGAYVAGQVADAVGAGNVFLPFCDTDEETLVSDRKGQALFELDCARLRQITGMIAILHGPSLDDGVCMEIGFAAALGVPVVVVTTDFQTFATRPDGTRFTFAEPLLETITTTIIRSHRLGPSPGVPPADRFGNFLAQNVASVRAAAAHAVTELVAAGSTRPAHPDLPPIPAESPLAYVEPSPYIPDQMWSAIAEELIARGWKVYVAQRFRPEADAVRAARADWTAASAANMAVIDTRGPETPPGAALITGACTATSRPVLAAHTGTWCTYADGREPNWRNLMIQYAVTARFSSHKEFTAAIEHLPCTAT